MLTIICGEDTAASRTYFMHLQNEYQKKGYFLQTIQPSEIEAIVQSEGAEGMLFVDKKLYVVDHLTSYTARKKSKEFEAILKRLVDSSTVEVITWEAKSQREIKLKATGVKEFKPSHSIFQLQESCFPGNSQEFIQTMRQVAQTQEEGFIFTMLSRHIRTLLQAKTDQLPATVPFWMKKKLHIQADRWSLEGLLGFYEGLGKLDLSIKTGMNLYGIVGSIELLACYFLK